MTFGAQTDEATARTMVDRCLEHGVNFFDTANVYNQGASETILGQALKGRRSRVVLASKVAAKMGDAPDQAGLSRAAIRRAIDESLQWYGRVAALDPTHSKATQALRHAYAERGDTAGLIDLLRRDMLSTEGERAKARLSAEIAALELNENKNPAAAERAARQALEWDPSNLRAAILVGDIAFAAHRFADRPFRVLYLVLDPGVETLDRRIDARAQSIIDAGLLRECRWLREQGYGPELRPLQSIGYRHVMPVVDGLDTLAGALEGMRRDTRRFARRQRTWFRAVADAEWLHPDERAAIEKRVAEFLG